MRSGGHHAGKVSPQIPKQVLSQINNQNVSALIGHLGQRYKSLDMIHRISYILEELMEFQYFKLLKSRLPEVDYFTVIERLSLVYQEKDSVIIEKRKRNDYFHVILWGNVTVLDEVSCQRDQEERKFQVINKLTPGDTFGQASLMHNKREASARVQAATSTLLLVLSFEVFGRTAMKITIIKKQQNAQVFCNSSLFFGVDQDSVKDLASQVFQLRLGLNEVVYSPGTQQDSIYFVKQGSIELSEQGVALVVLGPGESFGVEDSQLAEGVQMKQMAVSRANNSVLLRVSFIRLKTLHTFLQNFLKNLRTDVDAKRLMYDSMLSNHKRVQKLIVANTLNPKKPYRKRKLKNNKILKTPEWWGVASKTTNNNRLNKQVPPTSEKQNLPSSGLLGPKRIKLLLQSVINSKIEFQSLDQESPVVLSATGFQTSLPKKEIRKNINNADGELLKKKIAPELKKEKLLSYAKSEANCCETMFAG